MKKSQFFSRPCVYKGKCFHASSIYVALVMALGGTSFSNSYAFTGTVNAGNSPVTGEVVIGGTQTVDSGGLIEQGEVRSTGKILINSGGQANATQVNGGELEVMAGGVANDSVLNVGLAADSISVNGGTVNRTQVLFTPSGTIGGQLVVSNGGLANDTAIKGKGSGNPLNLMGIDSGGTADRVSMEDGVRVTVVGGGHIKDATLVAINHDLTSNWLVVTGINSTAEGTQVNRRGLLDIYAGALSLNATINEGGRQIVRNAGISNNTTINSGGLTQLQDGSVANTVTIGNRGVLVAQDLSTSDGILQQEGGVIQTSTDATITNSSHVKGNFSIISHVADNLLLERDAYLDVYSDGTANSSTVRQGGALNVLIGGQLGGVTTIAGDLVVIDPMMMGGNTLQNNGDLVFNRSFDSNLFYSNDPYWAANPVDIVITGAGSLVQAGSGTLALNVVQQYTGATTVNNGALRMDVANAVQSSSDVVVNAGFLNLNGHDQWVNRLAGTGGAIELHGAALTVNNSLPGADDSVFAGNIVAGTATGDLIKTGNGQLTLQGLTRWSQNTVLQGGTLTLDGYAGKAQLESNIRAQSGTHFNLVNGALLTGMIDTANVSIDGMSAWNMTGNSDVNNLTLNGTLRVLRAGGAAPFNQLVINGKLSGQGAIFLNTNLGDQQGDLITVDETQGSYLLYVTNYGGAPATKGQYLRIIDVSSAALSNAQFTLNNGAVDVGAYRYELKRGEDFSGGDAGDLYLLNTGYSNLTRSTVVFPSASKYAAMASLDNLHKRLGEIRLDDDHQGDVWTRFYGRSYTLRFEDEHTQRIIGAEMGYDHLFRFDHSRFYAGVMMGTTHSTTDGNGYQSDKLKSIQIGGYGTWNFDSGLYVDLVGRYFWFDSDHRTLPRSSGGGYETGSSRHNVFAFDAEVGQKFSLANNWFVEPQLQVIWLHQARNSYVSSLGNYVAMSSNDTLNLRTGIAVGKGFESVSGERGQVYARLDWTRDLHSNGQVYVNGQSIDVLKDDGSVIIALGAQMKRQNMQFDIEVESGLGSSDVKQDWGVNFGARWMF